MKALRALERGDDEEGDGSETADDSKHEAHNLTDRLTQRLSAHRTAALQIEVARQPHVALAATVHGMVNAVLFQGYRRDHPMGVRLTLRTRLAELAPGEAESPAVAALRDLHQTWTEKLPVDSHELFATLLAMPQDALVELLAVCVAASVDVVLMRASHQLPGAELARAASLDMAAWWKPTAEGYFRHVSKAAILEAVGQFAPDEVARLSKLKKAEAASEAQRLVEGTGWMPGIFAARRESEEASLQAAIPAGDEAGAGEGAGSEQEAGAYFGERDRSFRSS